MDSSSKKKKYPRTVLIGNEYQESCPPSDIKNPIITLKGHNGNVVFDNDRLSKGVLLIGAPGCGKTTLTTEMTDQIIPQMTPDDIMVIFDTKGDYIEKFYYSNNPSHILVSPTDISGIASSWSTFGETFDENGFFSEKSFLYAHEISKGLFKGLESQTQPFFHIAASDIFKMILWCVLIDAIESGDLGRANNSTLSEILEDPSVSRIYEMAERHPEFKYIKGYLGNPEKPTTQSLGILGYLNAMFSTQYVGSFKKTYGRPFSIRSLIRNKGAKIVFIKYDITFGELLSPVYSLLYDLAIKEALSIGKGNTYFVCDEMQLLPYCNSFKNVTNFGRSRGVKLIAGFQNINQLYANYGVNEGKSIAAGFANVLCFNSYDDDTRQFMRDRLGRTFECFSFASTNIPHDGYTINDGDFRSFLPGEAIVDIPGEMPFKFRLKMN